MSYLTTIPFSGESLGQSRPQVQKNFEIIQQGISQDHIGLSSSGQGKHNKSTYPIQATSPAALTDELAVYSQTVNYPSAISNPELLVQPENQIAGHAGIQLTRLDTGVLNSADGYSFLPGGLIMQWGTGSFVGLAVAVTITFPIAFPTAAYTFYAFPIGFNNIFHGDTLNLTSVIVSKNQAVGSGQSFWWMAIGN